MVDATFLFACCQTGVESVLKSEMARNHPEWRFAFSRPGFLTFKWLGEQPPSERLQLKSVFARTYGWSLGSIEAGDEAGGWTSLLERVQGMEFQQLHVWRRQPRGMSAGLPETVTAQEQRVGEDVLGRLQAAGHLPSESQLNQVAGTGQRVCDVVLLAEKQGWVGWHRANALAQRWPGGVPPIDVPESMVSRAFLKMEEALLWSELPIRAGDRCVEIGSAPGGASQSLLNRGLHVLGVDPAEMHPDVLAHPNFRHLRKRGADVQRSEFRGYRWLVDDANVAPMHTLDTVAAIVAHPTTKFQGLLLTLKLMQWSEAERMSEFVQRVRSWGFDYVRVRQLAGNHQEVCLVALRSRGMRRPRVSPPAQAARK